jgi:hypothetical protein
LIWLDNLPICFTKADGDSLRLIMEKTCQGTTPVLGFVSHYSKLFL